MNEEERELLIDAILATDHPLFQFDRAGAENLADALLELLPEAPEMFRDPKVPAQIRMGLLVSYGLKQVSVLETFLGNAGVDEGFQSYLSLLLGDEEEE